MVNKSLPKEQVKILLLEGVHQSALETFQRAGYTNVEYLKTSLPESELIERIADVHFVGIRSRTQLNAKVFAAANELLAVGCFCIGTNQVDLAAATQHGVSVFNAPYSNTRSVAELVLAEAVLLLRGIPEKNASAHQGKWLKSAANSFEVRGKTLGIVGYGNIGTQLGVIAESLGMKVCFYDVVTKLPLGNTAQVASLSELLAVSDVVSFHVPETSETRNLVGKKELSTMKQGAVLINASRGTVIDIEALVEALESGHVAGCAIDVFPVEPRSNNEEFISPLRAFNQAILTPHIGGSTMEAQENIGLEVAEKLVRYSGNGTSTSSVNFPEVALPAHEGQHRLLHIHNNVPGVMSAINRVFSENEINIRAQYLQTNDRIGYVVIDVEAEYSELALEKLNSIDATVRCRVLS